MLLIFDLDDTLVDTSGCLTAPLLERALDAMYQAGLSLSDREEAVFLLRRLNDRSLSAAQALSEFVEICEGTQEMLAVGKKTMYHFEEIPFPLNPLEGALEVLKDLKRRHCLTLVTIGKATTQLEKLKKAGIDSSLFSKIVVSEGEQKGPFYQALIQEFGFLASEVLVCGDRVARDLSPAKEIGCRTVLMKWGRGLNAELPHPDVDQVISSLRELKDMV